MAAFTRNVLTGLITTVPIVLTFYLLYWLVVSAEAVLGGVLTRVLPADWYRPGMGVVTGVALLFVVGMLMHNYVVQAIFARGEQLFYRIPLVKMIYPALRDFMDYFSPVKKKEFQQVVVVTLPGGLKALGLVTRADMERLPTGFNDSDSLLVYMPMAYMIGGYALLVPRRDIAPVDMGMEEAMRFILTAGVTGGGAGNAPGAARTPRASDPPPSA